MHAPELEVDALVVDDRDWFVAIKIAPGVADDLRERALRGSSECWSADERQVRPAVARLVPFGVAVAMNWSKF
jgi:hypothetical protein